MRVVGVLVMYDEWRGEVWVAEGRVVVKCVVKYNSYGVEGYLYFSIMIVFFVKYELF